MTFVDELKESWFTKLEENIPEKYQEEEHAEYLEKCNEISKLLRNRTISYAYLKVLNQGNRIKISSQNMPELDKI